MAGLLDFLDSPGASMGLGLLAAGGPTTDPNQAGFGQNLARGVQIGRSMQDQQDDRKLKQAYLQGQIDAQKRAELEYQDKKAAGQFYYGLLGGGPGAPSNQGGSLMPTAPGGGNAFGGASPAVASQTGGAVDLGRLTPQQMIGLQFAAKQAGAPDPTEILKLARPDMQVSNGFAYDKNNLAGGFIPQLNISQNGQASMVLPGQNGLPVVMAPQGAVETARAYADLGNQSQARYSAGRPVIGADNRMYGQSVLSEIGGDNMPAQAGVTGAFTGRPEAIVQAIAAIKDPQERANAMAALQEQARRENIGNGQLVGNLAASAQPAKAGAVDFSPAEKAQQEAQRVTAVEQAKADVTPTSQKVNKYTAASDAIGLIDKALVHPGLSKATGLGVWNPVNKVPGTEGADFNVLRDQLRGTAFLSAYNELKGGGAITETEGKKAEDAIARLNTAQSEKAFREALGDYRTILERGMKRAAGTLPPGSVDDLPDRSKTPPAGRLKTAPSQADLQNTALKYNMTVDQVKQKLGIR